MINQSISIQNKNVRNRVIVPAMASQTADANGFVTLQTLNHYERLSESGAGILFVEYSFVDVSGRSEPNQLGASSDAHFEGLAQVAEVIKKSGAIAGLQITHAGGKAQKIYSQGDLWGPSDVKVPVKNLELDDPNPLPLEKMEWFQQCFLNAARNAWLAGFEFIELHVAHGYGLNQWVSGYTNQRNDSYGGTKENRFRILLELIQKIKAQNPELLISLRFPGTDFLEGGLTAFEAQILAQNVEKSGAHLLNVSSGLGGWRRPNERLHEGYLVPEAIEIAKKVSIPVSGVGGIQTREYIDSLLEGSKLQFVSIGRAILNDPRAARWSLGLR